MDVQISFIVFSGIVTAFLCTLLLILGWYDWRKASVQLLALLVIFIVLWNIGALLSELESLTILLELEASIRLLIEIGFVGSGVVLYALVINFARLYTAQLRMLFVISLLILVAYQIFISLISLNSPEIRLPANPIYLALGLVTIFVTFRYRKRFSSLALRFSIVLFVIGQTIPLFNSQIATTKLALVLCSCSTLGLGLTILWREIISPIRERSQQIINMREVAQTVSARTDLEELLADITNQAALWLHADGAAIFLTGSNEECKLVAMWQLPQSYSNHVVRIGEGIVGRSIQTGQTLIREASDADYADMVQSSFPDGTELFGCVMSSPFNDKQNLAGAIVVISNRQGKVFSEDDRVLLEIMASEVSIGIAYSQINHEIEGSRRNLEHVLDTTGNPIVTVNELGAIQYANKTARDLQGKGQSLVPPDWKANPKRQIWYEQKIETRYYNCQSIELEGRTPLEWLIVYNDITREKEITSLRDDVIRLASHDIKNPLQGAIANLELLQDDLLNTPNPEVQISLRELDTQLRRIEEITTTILGSKQQFVNEVHAISSILTDATDAMRGQASSRQHEMILLKPDDFTFIKGSRDQLKRAFMNLLDNAIKYSPDGSKIRVSTYQDNDHIIIEFHDTGIGIPLSIQSKIFSPFFRGEEHGQQSTHSTGSGVGLNIVKGIIENHGGNIWFTSKEQEGTTFFVSLPVNQRLEPTERF